LRFSSSTRNSLQGDIAPILFSPTPETYSVIKNSQHGWYFHLYSFICSKYGLLWFYCLVILQGLALMLYEEWLGACIENTEGRPEYLLGNRNVAAPILPITTAANHSSVVGCFCIQCFPSGNSLSKGPPLIIHRGSRCCVQYIPASVIVLGRTAGHGYIVRDGERPMITALDGWHQDGDWMEIIAWKSDIQLKHGLKSHSAFANVSVYCSNCATIKAWETID
jgi:hypothetical protein